MKINVQNISSKKIIVEILYYKAAKPAYPFSDKDLSLSKKRRVFAINMVLKKAISLILVLAFALGSFGVFASEGMPAEGDVIETAAGAGLQMDATAAILVDSRTGTVLYEKNADEPRAIASITKVMTLILVMEALERGAIGLEDKVTASEHAYSMGGSQIWLEPGEVMTVNELLKAVCVASANDAAVALAEYVSGSEDEFVAEMNRKAQSLGMTKTTFKNSNGLDEEGHMSSAHDVALMSREILKHELIRNYITIWTDELRGGETELTNTNKLLKSYNGITGIKTGTTNKAGVCVTASAVRDNMELIAVVLGSSDSKSRFEAAKTMLNYGFSNYELVEIKVDDALFTPVEVECGESQFCEYTAAIPECMVVKKGAGENIRYEVSIEPSVEAPVLSGQTVGRVTVFCGENELGGYDVTAKTDIRKIDFKIGWGLLFNALTNM